MSGGVLVVQWRLSLFVVDQSGLGFFHLPQGGGELTGLTLRQTFIDELQNERCWLHCGADSPQPQVEATSGWTLRYFWVSQLLWNTSCTLIQRLPRAAHQSVEMHFCLLSGISSNSIISSASLSILSSRAHPPCYYHQLSLIPAAAAGSLSSTAYCCNISNSCALHQTFTHTWLLIY